MWRNGRKRFFPSGAVSGSLQRLVFLVLLGTVLGCAPKETDNVATLTGSSVSLAGNDWLVVNYWACLLYTSPSPRDATLSRMPSSA